MTGPYRKGERPPFKDESWVTVLVEQSVNGDVEQRAHAQQDLDRLIAKAKSDPHAVGIAAYTTLERYGLLDGDLRVSFGAPKEEG